jgi:hypothetical protein
MERRQAQGAVNMCDIEIIEGADEPEMTLCDKCGQPAQIVCTSWWEGRPDEIVSYRILCRNCGYRTIDAPPNNT